MESQVDLQIPAKLVLVFATEGIRYRGAHGAEVLQRRAHSR